jgi:DNA-binding NtrC family response regulator
MIPLQLYGSNRYHCIRMENEKTYILFMVEDHEAYSFMLKYELERSSKYKVIMFQSIKECLETPLNPDLIILDCNLSEMNDLEMLSNLKEKYPKRSIVVLTHTEDRGVFHEFVRDGTFDYLLKEVGASRLADRLLRKIEAALLKNEQKERKVLRIQTIFWVFLFCLTVASVFWLV